MSSKSKKQTQAATMEIVKSENVNVRNSVLVSGLTQTEKDEEVEEHLRIHGAINRVLLIDNPESEFHRSSIVEFVNSSAIDTLGPTLPLQFQSSTDTEVTFCVRSLGSVYTSTASRSATKGYLEELQAIASKSGKSFQEVLQEELMKMRTEQGVILPVDTAVPIEDTAAETARQDPLEHPDALTADGEADNVQAPVEQQPSLLLSSVSPEIARTLPAVFPPSPSVQRGQLGSRRDTQAAAASARSPLVMPSLATTAATPSVLTVNDVNPPAVQRVVVEHVMRANEALSPMHSSFRLRPFSGKIPRPNSELDYETWRANVDLILTDPSMSDLHRTRKILDSLLPPATDVTKHVSPQSLPSVYLQLLDSVYGSVEDGDELLAKFMVTLQNQDEKPSNYLNRLQVALSAVVRRGGVVESERDRYLLKQFCRGCWNDGLISDLQLEQKAKAPPSFTELVLLIRAEEDKQASKQSRMKQHLGLDKQSPAAMKLKSAAQQLSACSCATYEKEPTETECLKKQLNEIQAQVAVMQTSTPCKAKGKRPDTTELQALKKQVAGVQAQIADMRTATHEVNSGSLESAEVKALKHQLAILQAQVNSPQAQNQQIPLNACAKEFAMRVQQKPTNKKASGQSSSGQAARGRPRPWYCFHCGEDAHLAANCVNEPNPPLVEEKRRQLKERQEKWDQQNGSIGTQQLNC